MPDARPRMSPVEQRRETLLQRSKESPRAFQTLAFTRKYLSTCVWGALIGFMVCLSLPPVGMVVFSVSFVAAFDLALVRISVIALFFTRYSLGQMMAMSLSLSTFVSITMVTPDDWKFFPGFATATLVLLIVVFVNAQDPHGDNLMPGFIRQQVIQRRVQRRLKAREEEQRRALESGQKSPDVPYDAT